MKNNSLQLFLKINIHDNEQKWCNANVKYIYDHKDKLKCRLKMIKPNAVEKIRKIIVTILCVTKGKNKSKKNNPLHM